MPAAPSRSIDAMHVGLGEMLMLGALILATVAAAILIVMQIFSKPRQP